MNLQQAMSYVKNTNNDGETIAAMRKWLGHYCVFIIMYDEDDGYCIEYNASKLNDVYGGEQEYYSGDTVDELTADMIDLIDPNNLKFCVYQTRLSADVIPHMYHQLLPDLMPDYDKPIEPDLYVNIVDRALHHINNVA